MPNEYPKVVRDFYQAVGAKDAAALGELVPKWFAEDVRLIWPESLPYGGTVTGNATVGKLFRRMAASPEPVGVDGLVVVDLVDGGDRIAAQLRFDWYAPGSRESIRTGALELWTFTDGLVREIRAYYWDTAACVARMTAAGS